jgi:hypothetical protein
VREVARGMRIWRREAGSRSGSGVCEFGSGGGIREWRRCA